MKVKMPCTEVHHKTTINILHMYNLLIDSANILNTRLTIFEWMERINTSYTYLKDLVANLETQLAKVVQLNVIHSSIIQVIQK